MAATLKHSRQRDAIKEFLMTRTDHPTADTVYQELREVYPNISLEPSTVTYPSWLTSVRFRNFTLAMELTDLMHRLSPITTLFVPNATVLTT